MLQLKFVNAKGKSIDALQIRDDSGRLCAIITACDGLHGIDLEMSSSTSPYFDGDQVDHMRANPRSINLTYHLCPPIADSLNFINSIVKTKQKANLIETRDDGTQIKIEGIVNIPTYTRLSDATSIQIQLYCSRPYWEDAEIIVEDISTVVSMFYFPFENEEKLAALDGGLAFPVYDSEGNVINDGIPVGLIDIDATKVFENNGDDSVGMIIEIEALQTLKNPMLSKINSDENEFILVNTTMESGDWIRINTTKGEKSVVKNGENLFNEVSYGGKDWLQLSPGTNELTITAQDLDGNAINSGLYFTIHYKQKWQ